MITSLPIYQSETGTKWPTLCRRYVQMHFLEWKFFVRLKLHWSYLIGFLLSLVNAGLDHYLASYFVTTSLIGWAHAWNQPCIRPCFQSPSSDRWSSVWTVATDICIKLGSSLPENQHVLQATWVNTNGEIFYYAQKLLSQVRIDHSHSFCTM